jgi:hypothetical protein
MRTLETHKRNRSLSPTRIDLSKYSPDLISEQDGQTPPPAKRRNSPTLEQTPLLAVEPFTDSPNPVEDGICRSSVLSEGKPVDPGQVIDGVHETKSGKDQQQPSAKILSPIDLTCQSTSLPVTTSEENPVTNATGMKDCLGDGLSESFAEESDEYDVEEIVDHDIYEGYTRYRVK